MFDLTDLDVSVFPRERVHRCRPRLRTVLCLCLGVVSRPLDRGHAAVGGQGVHGLLDLVSAVAYPGWSVDINIYIFIATTTPRTLATGLMLTHSLTHSLTHRSGDSITNTSLF